MKHCIDIIKLIESHFQCDPPSAMTVHELVSELRKHEDYIQLISRRIVFENED